MKGEWKMHTCFHTNRGVDSLLEERKPQMVFSLVWVGWGRGRGVKGLAIASLAIKFVYISN